MKYPKLTITLIASSLLLLSGCNMGTHKDKTPNKETSEGASHTTSKEKTVAGKSNNPAKKKSEDSQSVQKAESKPKPQPKPVNVVATTTIKTTTGRTIQVDKTNNGFVFHGYEGKIVLLEVYGDTCPHCVNAISSYNKIQAKYPNDVVIIALESYGTLRHAGQQKYITIPKAKTGKMFAFIQDLTGYHREAVPFLMIFDRNGDKVYQKTLANFPESEIDHWIQSLL